MRQGRTSPTKLLPRSIQKLRKRRRPKKRPIRGKRPRPKRSHQRKRRARRRPRPKSFNCRPSPCCQQLRPSRPSRRVHPPKVAPIIRSRRKTRPMRSPTSSGAAQRKNAASRSIWRIKKKGSSKRRAGSSARRWSKAPRFTAPKAGKARRAARPRSPRGRRPRSLRPRPSREESKSTTPSCLPISPSEWASRPAT